MAKKIYFGIGTKARVVRKIFFGVNGKARKVKKAYIGINNVARLFYSAGVQPGLYVLGGYDYNLYRFDESTLLAVTKLPIGSYIISGTYTEPISKVNSYAWGFIPCGATDSQVFLTNLESRVSTFLDPVTGVVAKSITKTTTDPLLSGGNQQYVFGTMIDNTSSRYIGFRYYAYDQNTLALSITSPFIQSGYIWTRGTGGLNNTIFVLHHSKERDSDGDSYMKYYVDCYELSTGTVIRNEVTNNSEYSRPSGKDWIDMDSKFRYRLTTYEYNSGWAYFWKQDANTRANIQKFGGSGGAYGDIMTYADYKRMESLFVVKG